MKKIIFTLLIVLCSEVFADGNSLVIVKRKPDDSGMDQITLAVPTVSSLLYQDITDYKPKLVTLGANLSLVSGVLSASGGGAAQVNSDWSATSGVAQILSKPTMLAGYGIVDAYPLAGNPSAFLTSISGAQVTTALGFTPYNATNPNAYIALPAARSGISLTSTGSAGAATYNSTTGVINVPNYGLAAPQTAIVGVTPKTGSYRLYQSFTVTTAGTAVFQLTADGTSTGTALFPTEVFTDSVQPIVNDATSSYQFSWALTNSNKTLTVTINKLTTANILTGILGQAAAPVGTVVKVMVEGR